MSFVTTRPVRTTLAVLAGAALALGPALAPATAADTQVGATFPSNGMNCSVPSPGATVLQATSPANAYLVASAGVITSWRSQPAGSEVGVQMALKVGRGSGSSFSIVGSSTPLTVSGAAVQQNVRVPVQAGDVLGFWYQGDGNCARLTDATWGANLYLGNLATGPAPAPDQALAPLQINIAATVEPDVDGDGFGDTTQDLCPKDATTQGVCVGPVTTISAVKAKKATLKANGKPKKAKVTVTFSTSKPGSSTCSVDGAAAKPCASPFRFKAKVGKHNVTVTSTDAAGTVGAAVTTKVKVKKAKAKK